MLYQLQYEPQDNVLVVNLNFLVTENSISFLGGPEEAWHDEDKVWLKNPLETFIKDLFEVRGVNGVEFQRYAVIIHKAVLFKWNDITTFILGVIRDKVLSDCGEELVLGKPTTCSFYDEAGIYRKIKEQNPDELISKNYKS